MCWLGLGLNLSELSGDVYLNVSISAVLEIPICLTCYYVCKHSGRKPSVVGSMLLAGVSMIISVPFELFSGEEETTKKGLSQSETDKRQEYIMQNIRLNNLHFLCLFGYD